MSVKDVAQMIENGEKLTIGQIYEESERAVLWILRYGIYRDNFIYLSGSALERMVSGDGKPWIPTASGNLVTGGKRDLAKGEVRAMLQSASNNQDVFTTLQDYLRPADYSPKGLISGGLKVGAVGVLFGLGSYGLGLVNSVPESIAVILGMIGVLLMIAVPFSVLLAVAAKLGGNKPTLVSAMGAADMAYERLTSVEVARSPDSRA
jgi:hypothetical protein